MSAYPIWLSTRTNSHVEEFAAIFLVQADGVTPDKHIILATNVSTELGQLKIDLPKKLIPSNACESIDKWLTIKQH